MEGIKKRLWNKKRTETLKVVDTERGNGGFGSTGRRLGCVWQHKSFLWPGRSLLHFSA